MAQTNVNVQDDTTAIAAWGGDATAVQVSGQSNENSQTGVAVASNHAEDIEQENEVENPRDGGPGGNTNQ